MTVEHETSKLYRYTGMRRDLRIFVRLRSRDDSTRLAWGTWFLGCIRSALNGDEYRRYAGPTGFPIDSIDPPESRTLSKTKREKEFPSLRTRRSHRSSPQFEQSLSLSSSIMLSRSGPVVCCRRPSWFLGNLSKFCGQTLF